MFYNEKESLVIINYCPFHVLKINALYLFLPLEHVNFQNLHITALKAPY